MVFGSQKCVRVIGPGQDSTKCACECINLKNLFYNLDWKFFLYIVRANVTKNLNKMDGLNCRV
jgi:hypothetical protein